MMSREEYMNQLKKALEGCSPERSQEILEDFNEHFEIGLANGSSEEEIIESLGNISEFINELKNEPKPTLIVDQNIHSAVIYSDKGDIEIKMGNKMEYELKNWKSTSHAYYDFECYTENQTYYFKLHSKPMQLPGILKNVKMKITLPAGLKLEAQTKLGDIEIEKGIFDQVDIKTQSGDFEGDITGKEISVDNALGDIKGSFKADKSVHAFTSKGDVKCNANAPSINLESRLGDVKAHIARADEVFMKSSLGDIKLNISGNDSFDISYTKGLGDIKCRVRDVTLKKHGFIKNDGKCKIELISRMGDIEITD